MDEKKHRLLTSRKPHSEPADESLSADESLTATKPKPMTTWSIVWRLGATAVALIILTCGQFLNTNDFFPLGSLTQYATAKDLNGTVNSTCIEAQFPGEDEPRRLGFNPATVGIERGDIESQLDRVITHPELLQTLADSFERLHPDEPKPEKMILCRSVTQLENGRSVGEPEHKILATWEVQ
ncbi:MULTISPECIES: hypothetical protein [unclassified Brevibacterium]|uniref:hypothetical protein n=1 Tax=unclassified Brevibacterium TaxID=2614124 RepID=UPI001867F46D|nr:MULTISPECIES: hypothetical protein [unclassified Brevibacterium]